MATYKTYGSGAGHDGYAWTGTNTLNQVASLVNIPEPIYVSSISVYVGGYGGSAPMFFAIWKSNGDLVVRSGTVNVPQGSLSRGGQSWNTKAISETYLEAGNYFVGFWRNPSYRSVWTLWKPGSYNDYYYRKTSTSTITSMAGRSAVYDGVLASYVTGEPAGRMWVNANGTWRKGNAWINANGTWKKSKGVWVNQSGNWKRGK